MYSLNETMAILLILMQKTAFVFGLAFVVYKGFEIFAKVTYKRHIRSMKK